MTLTASFTPPTAAFPDDGTDPYIANVKLLLHCDGTDGSTTFTDVAGHTVTASGNVQIDTAQSKFGGASAYFDGTGDYLSIAHATDFDVATGADFTAECWVRWEAAPSLNSAVFSGVSTTTLRWTLIWRPASENRLAFYDAPGSFTVGRTVLATGVWYHVAVCRRGYVVSVYLDGNLDLCVPHGTAYDCTALVVGAAESGNSGMLGWIDDLRYTAGVARYAPIPPAIKSDLSTAYSVGYGHTWAEQDRTLYPIVPTWSDEVTVERYPTYAYTGGNYHELERNGRIAGTLLEAGVPKVDTWVFLSYRLTAQVVAGTRTDANGNFEFLNLYPNAKYLVSAYESRTNPPGYNVVSADYITPVLMAA